MGTEYIKIGLKQSTQSIALETFSLRNKAVHKSRQFDVSRIINRCLHEAGDLIKEYARTHHKFSRRGDSESSEHLEDNIFVEVKRYAMRVFIDMQTVPYAKYVVNGTRPHYIFPRHAKALRFWDRVYKQNRDARGRFASGFHTEKGAVRFAKYVHHPGTDSDDFLTEAGVALKPKIEAMFKNALLRKVRRL